MRHAVLLLAALAAALALAAPATAANPQIAGLQVALRAQGLYCGPVDGIAGPQTVAAVRAFQQRARLAVDGRAGPATRRALGPLGGPLFGRRPLVPGRFGWDVAVLQFLLARQGHYKGPLDGYFGGATAKALRRYQRAFKLAPDGVAGPATYAALGFQTKVPTAPPAREPAPAEPTPTEVRARIDRTAARYGVDVHLARALAWMESGYQTNLTSSAGAWGTMQILPQTWDFVEEVLLGRRVPRTTEGNIEVGIAYLRHLLREFRGDERLALAAWYQGARAVREHGLYDETKQFTRAVLALRTRL